MKRLIVTLTVLTTLVVLAAVMLVSVAVPIADASPAPQVPTVVAPQGPLEEGHWPMWDNGYAEGEPPESAIPDCTFAAVADWEILKGYPGPMQAQLVHEYIAAGGNENGLFAWQWKRWLLLHGVNGIRLRLVPVSLSAMDAEVAAHGAVIVGTASHVYLVAGYNATGPEVITFGETRQETWLDWNEQKPEEAYVPVVIH